MKYFPESEALNRVVKIARIEKFQPRAIQIHPVEMHVDTDLHRARGLSR